MCELCVSEQICMHDGDSMQHTCMRIFFLHLCTYLCVLSACGSMSKTYHRDSRHRYVSVFPCTDLRILLVLLGFIIEVCRTPVAKLRPSGSWRRSGERTLPEYMKALGHAGGLFNLFLDWRTH